MSTANAGLFSTIRPFGAPPTPILSLILTYALNVIASPRQYYGPLLGENNQDPATLLARAKNEKGVVSHEQQVKITRSQGAADNLKENMPLFVVASLVGWLGGVKPEYQNLYHFLWLVGRYGYKYAYLQGKGELRSGLFMVAQIATITMLIHGGNALAAKTQIFG
ncbi:uncharacterized protein K452DRAFT_87627 [Aplosporella prunicola CBS 121167]|uniref:Uncharacterized protein n=1 Tax=Aplosporella prunicola CBS 121167 TaxID=1176127 RepID=A0A6A6B3X0_9PEZI|nr:uncharacterized protein K452DRAFT_87627 [Aplosporella prunicola CBS 121167]KAF2138516.1 hypothetical protein K452DRAFT_87627 [Aplosporella prunicola CBS 121167]